MAVAVVGTPSTYVAYNNGSQALPYPTGSVASGNVAYLAVAVYSTFTVTTPTGYTAVAGFPFTGTNERVYLFRKVLAGSESGSVTATISGAGELAATLFVLSGVDNTTPENVVGTRTSGYGTAVTFTSVTTTLANDYVLAVLGSGQVGSMPTTFGSGLTKITDASNSTDYVSVSVGAATQAAAGASASYTATYAAANSWTSLLVGLKAATGTPPPAASSARVNVAGTLANYTGRINLAGTLHPFTGITFPTVTAAPLANIPMAVYRANATLNGPKPAGQTPGSVADYEIWIGKTLFAALEYLASDTQYNQTYPSWVSGPWQATGRRMVLGGCGTPVGSDTWAMAASGSYDSTWTTMCSNMVAAGQTNPILRPAHEFNGYFAYATKALANKTDFIAAWKRFVGIVRTNLPNAVICWNPAVANDAPSTDWTSMYPGDAYVDQIGLDFYDSYYSAGYIPGSGTPPTLAQRQAVWAADLPYLNDFAAFAVSHSKPLCVPEWGFLNDLRDTDGTSHYGGDNDYFVTTGAQWIKDHNCIWQAFWENPDQGVYDPDADSGRGNIPVPNARAAFRAAVGATP